MGICSNRARRHPVPNTVNGKVPPCQCKNAELRSREYLTPGEVERLMDAAEKHGRLEVQKLVKMALSGDLSPGMISGTGSRS